MAELTYAQVSQILKYDAETGKLFWKERPSYLFQHSRHGAEINAKQWNTKFATKEAFTTIGSTGYYQGAIFNQRLSAHRVAWLLHYGNWPLGMIDHENGIRTDNRICNLSDISVSQNAKNSRRSSANKSGFGGVVFHRSTQKWQAQIVIEGQSKYLGLYETKEEAIAVRMEEQMKLGFTSRHGS